MENLKETQKQIRRISNRATLPILVYCILYLGFTAPVTLITTIYLITISVLNTIFGYFWFLK